MVFKPAKLKKAEQNQNWNFHRHVFNAIFLFTQHSSVFQIIPWNWKQLTNCKVQGKKVFWHVILHSYLCNALFKFLIKIESTRRREIKKQAPQLTLLYRGRTVRSSHRRCCIRKLFLKILQYPQETPVLESIFKKVADL